MQKKLMQATIMSAVSSVVMFVAMGSGSAYASFVSSTPELPGIEPAGYSNLEQMLNDKVPEQAQRGAGNASGIACHPVSDALAGGCTFNDVVSIVREDGRYSPMVLNFRADGRSSVAAPAAVPIPATVWLFGSGLLGLVGLARRKIS